MAFISPLTKSPTHVYTLSEGIIWISKGQNSLISKIEDYSLLTTILIKLEQVLKCKIVRFNLSKELVNQIFGFESIKRASYKEMELSGAEEYLENKNVSDRRFSSKKEAKLLDHRCERPYSLNRIITDEKNVTASFNESGRSCIYGRISRSILKKWCVNIIKDYNPDAQDRWERPPVVNIFLTFISASDKSFSK